MATFDNIILDSTFSVNGWRASRESDVTVVTTKNGSESRFSKSPYPRRKYEIPYQKMSMTNRLYLYNFYEARNGPARSFKLWDRDNFYIANQSIGTGDGATTAFQLIVTSGDAVHTFNRNVLHPASTGTAIPPELQGYVVGVTTTSYTVKVNGVTKTETTDYTVSSSTGILTFVTAPAAAATLTVSFWYYTPVRFDGMIFDMDLHGIYGSTQAHLIEVFNE